MRLNIGGTEKKEGWEVLNIQGDVDHVCNAKKLPFEDNSIELVYASHILEHFGSDELRDVLKEWSRVTKELCISVPDLTVICNMLSRQDFAPVHSHLIAIIYGGQSNEYDFHKSGFTRWVLEGLLREVGFTKFERVKDFGFFEDSSIVEINEFPISLNLRARK